MLIDDLDDSNNTFVVIQPDYDPVWFASVAVLDEGGYEIVLRDASRREHQVTTETSISRIAKDLIHCIATRHRPGRQVRLDQGFQG